MKKLLLATSLLLPIPTLAQADFDARHAPKFDARHAPKFDAKHAPKSCRPTVEAVFAAHGENLKSFKNRSYEELEKYVENFSTDEKVKILKDCDINPLQYMGEDMREGMAQESITLGEWVELSGSLIVSILSGIGYAIMMGFA